MTNARGRLSGFCVPHSSEQGCAFDLFSFLCVFVFTRSDVFRGGGVTWGAVG